MQNKWGEYMYIKADQLDYLKKFCILTENVIFREQIRTPPGGNFASGAVWHTNAFKVPAFHFFGQELTDVPIWSTVLTLSDPGYFRQLTIRGGGL